MLKVFRSRANKVHSVLAYIEAYLFALYNKANSPKLSPGAYFFTNFYSSLIFLKQSNSPESTTYKKSPSSPYLIIQSFGLFINIFKILIGFNFHSINYNLFFFNFKCCKHKCLIQTIWYLQFLIICLFNEFRDIILWFYKSNYKYFSLIVSTKYFCGNWSSLFSLCRCSFRNFNHFFIIASIWRYLSL